MMSTPTNMTFISMNMDTSKNMYTSKYMAANNIYIMINDAGFK